VFEAFLPIFPIRPDGTHLRQLTEERPDGFTACSDPVYSPDGHQIMLLRSERTSEFEVITIGLSVMQKNGKKLRYVTDNPSEATQEHQPDWVLASRVGPGSSKSLTTGQAAPSSTIGERSDIYSHRR